MLEVSCTAFLCSTDSKRYTKLCEVRTRATAWNSAHSWLPPAVPAACVGGVQIHTTVIPGTTYPVLQHTAQHHKSLPGSCLTIGSFSLPWETSPGKSVSSVSNKTPCPRYLRALSWTTRACPCLYEAAMTSRIATAGCGCCYVHASNFELPQQ